MKTSIKDLIISIGERNGFKKSDFEVWSYKIVSDEPPNYERDSFLFYIKNDSSKYIFDKITDEEAKELLLAWVNDCLIKYENDIDIDWNMTWQFAKLISKKGYLIKDDLNKILDPDFVYKHPWNIPSMAAAGVLWLDDGIDRAKKLLNILNDDEHDGIFYAITNCDSIELKEYLLNWFENITTKFENENLGQYGTGTGEFYQMTKFVEKCFNDQTFSNERLDKLMSYIKKFDV